MNSLPAVTTMCLSFYILTSQELFQSTPDIHSRLDYMLQRYPRSSWLQSQRALLLYHSREYVRAEQIFSSILHADPHRLDALDHYSNLLYVLPDRPKLAFIAQLATATDKFRPETCCVVGNYYSLTSQHEKAIAYFRRALTLDRACLSAWTLLGHEYVELKNSHAAIEAYRRAVDVNAKDYRAWYGLGQTYELLEMYYYSLWYFQRAAALRPRDATIWAAVGNCWARMERWAEAIAAQKRALICAAAATNINRPDGTVPGADADADADDDFEALLVGRLDPDLLFKIAGWYEKAGEPERCAGYMRQVLAQEQDEPELQADTASPSASSTRRPSTARPSFLIPSSQPQPHSQSQSQPQPSLATRRLRASSSSFGPGVAAATAGVLPSSSATAAAMRRSQIEPGMGMGMGAALRTSFLAAAEGSAPSSPLGAVERGPSMPMEARTSFMGAGGLPSSQIGASATSTAGAGAAAGTRRGTSIGSAMTTAVGAAELARGTGVTATTSKARMWLARWEMAAGRFGVAGVLARELCEDGWEIEEAKGMVRDCRARGEDAGGGGG